MKNIITTAIVLSLSGLSLVDAAPAKMKMTTEVPEGVATPDTLETQLGTLSLFDGVPDAESAAKVYDYLDFHHAVNAYMNG